MHLYSSTDTDWKKSRFISSKRPDFHIIDNLSKAAHTFAMCWLTSLSVEEILLLRYGNWSAYFRGLPTSSGDGSFLFKTHEVCFILRSCKDQYLFSYNIHVFRSNFVQNQIKNWSIDGTLIDTNILRLLWT